MRRWGIVIRNMSLSVGLVIIGLSGCVAPSDEVQPGSSAPNLDEVIVILPDEGAPHEPEPTGPDRDPSFSYDFDDDVDHSAAPPAHASPSRPDGIGEAADGDYAYLIDLTDEEEAAAEAPIESGEASDAVGDQTSAGEGDEELAGDDAALLPEEDDQTVRHDPEKQIILKASRAFLRGSDFPPHGFAGFGVVAMSQIPSADDMSKARFVCASWLRSLVTVQAAAGGNQQPTDNQIVTVWPIVSSQAGPDMVAVLEAENVRAMSAENVIEYCDQAITYYDQSIGADATGIAKAAFEADGHDPQRVRKWLGGPGPFLLAWFPGENYRNQKSPVFCVDLAGISHPVHAQQIFLEWMNFVNEGIKRQAIPEGCWQPGWRIRTRLFLDREGQRWIGFLKSEEAEIIAKFISN